MHLKQVLNLKLLILQLLDKVKSADLLIYMHKLNKKGLRPPTFQLCVAYRFPVDMRTRGRGAESHYRLHADNRDVPATAGKDVHV